MKTWTGIAIIAAALAVTAYVEHPSDHADMSQRPRQDKVLLTAKEAHIADYLARNGSDRPVELAQVISRLKRPRLAAAVAVTESNGRDVRGKSGEVGIWQIIPADHGYVPEDLNGQAEKFEEVMEEYIRKSQGNLREALRRYNSGRPDRSHRYAERVMAQVARVQL